MKKEIECYDLGYISVEKQTKQNKQNQSHCGIDKLPVIPPQFERHLRDSEETCSKYSRLAKVMSK